MRLGVVIPTLNEETNLPFVLKSLHKVGVKEILVIDGNSTDRTTKVAEKLGIDVIFQECKGKGNASCQVFCNSYLDVDALVIMDAD